MKYSIIAAALAIVLSGCANKVVETVTVTEYKYVPVSIDSKLLKPFTVTRLIDKVDYVGMSPENSREVLLNMVIERNKVIQSCNIRMASITEESDRIADVVTKRNQDGK